MKSDKASKDQKTSESAFYIPRTYLCSGKLNKLISFFLVVVVFDNLVFTTQTVYVLYVDRKITTIEKKI
jgi:lipoprotein NlpI